MCHPKADLLGSLALKISVEPIVRGSRFSRLLCSVRALLSHRWFWFVPHKMEHIVSPQQLLCKKRLPYIWMEGPVEAWNAFSRT